MTAREDPDDEDGPEYCTPIADQGLDSASSSSWTLGGEESLGDEDDDLACYAWISLYAPGYYSSSIYLLPQDVFNFDITWEQANNNAIMAGGALSGMVAAALLF
mmetsp:Transcript_29969/g.45826  ORF Transcript_29969/g.45826 Transcript_29969/m.45826 type:complete len:104 (-) Transcript_29969:86-397(-)